MLFGYVLGDLLVAVLAQPRLRGLIERFMAVATFALVFGVALDDLARH